MHTYNGIYEFYKDYIPAPPNAININYTYVIGTMYKFLHFLSLQTRFPFF